MNSSSRRRWNIIIWTIAFALFTLLTLKGAFKDADEAVAHIISACANTSSDGLFSIIRYFGNLTICILIALTISIWQFFRTSGKAAVIFFTFFIFLVGAVLSLKVTIRQERPPELFYRKDVWYPKGLEDRIGYGKLIPKRFSYPSGHVSRATYLLWVMAMLIDKTRLSKRAKEALRGTSYSLITLVGISSIYLGAHWLSDVIGGYLLGYIFYSILTLNKGSGLHT